MNARWIVFAACAATTAGAHAATASANLCLRGWSLRDLNPLDGIQAAIGIRSDARYDGNFSRRSDDPGGVLTFRPGEDLGIPHTAVGATLRTPAGAGDFYLAYRNFAPGQASPGPYGGNAYSWTLSAQTELTYTLRLSSFMDIVNDADADRAWVQLSVRNNNYGTGFQGYSSSRELSYSLNDPGTRSRQQTLSFTLTNDTDAPMEFSSRFSYGVGIVSAR